jgi:type VI secretion system secreted protein VgrG
VVPALTDARRGRLVEGVGSIALGFESGESSLEARSFELHEALSTCFRAEVTALSPNDDLDLDELVGRAASLTLRASAHALPRRLRGVCLSAEQVQAESAGVSSYALTFGPKLALLGYRSRHRIFQHRTAVEIASTILSEWGIATTFALDAAQHPKLSYRVQHGETDLQFLARILEEAGITFTFPTEADDVDLLLEDASQSAEPLDAMHLDQPTPGLDAPFVTAVRVGRSLRSGRVVVRDQDFRLPGDSALAGDAAIRGREALVREVYVHGASIVESATSGSGTGGSETPVADAGGAERPSASALARAAELSLQRERCRSRGVSFQSNLSSLRPGHRVRVSGHPREELRGETLLVTELVTTGTVATRSWKSAASAVFTDVPFRPALRTSKPRALGVHAATVVGPGSERIHTDEFGRVRVRFAWDASEHADEKRSCWLRVSRGWAGGGHASFTLPRVGDEVLVGFFEGDPDQPVVVGSLHNATSPVPYKLPAHKTVSTWRSESVPTTGGFNEVRFEDQAGAELVSIQAERDLSTLVKQNERIEIGSSRVANVGKTDDLVVGERHSITIGQGDGATRIEATPGRILLTTGEARIVLDGPNITFDASGTFTVRAAGLVRVESSDGDVVVQGGPLVRINPRGAGEHPDAPGGAVPFELPNGVSGSDFDEEMTEVATRSWFDAERPRYLDDATAAGGPLDPAPRGDASDGLRAFKFAVAGRCLGLPEGVILRRAGALNRKANGPAAGSGDPGNGLFGGEAPYGNDPASHEAMQKGFEYFDMQYAEPS